MQTRNKRYSQPAWFAYQADSSTKRKYERAIQVWLGKRRHRLQTDRFPQASLKTALAALPEVRQLDPRWDDVNIDNFDPNVYPAHAGYWDTMLDCLQEKVRSASWEAHVELVARREAQKHRSKADNERVINVSQVVLTEDRCSGRATRRVTKVRRFVKEKTRLIKRSAYDRHEDTGRQSLSPPRPSTPVFGRPSPCTREYGPWSAQVAKRQRLEVDVMESLTEFGGLACGQCSVCHRETGAG